MARSLTASARAESQKSSGVEPFLVVEIEWGDGSRYYGDKSTYIGTLEIDGRILGVSPLQFSIAVDDLGSASVVSVTLSDNDLALRLLLESQRMENLPARVYHHFEGLAEADLVTVLNGVVTSPIHWDEMNRRLTFSIEGTANSQTVGYRPAEGDFSNLHEDGVGKVWPVCFGTVIDAPAALAKRAARGRLGTDLGMNDTTFDVIDGDDFPQGSLITLRVGEELISGTFSGALEGVRTFTITSRNQNRYSTAGFVARPALDPDVSDSHFCWVPDDGKRYVGLWCIVPAAYVPDSSIDKHNYCIAQEGTKLRFQHPWGNGNTSSWLIGATVFGDWRAFLNSSTYRIIKAGSPVTQSGSSEDVYVANEISSTAVLRVRAFKNVKYESIGASYRALVDVPSTYYTVSLADASLGAPSGRTPTTITFETRLSERGEWEDDIVYVSLTSSQGDNTADQIEWLLNNYTDLTPDTTAFATAEALVENYPSHFAITEQKDAVRACAEIAWQARCGLFTVGLTAYLRYLSVEPDAGDAAITLDDAQDNTLEDAAALQATDMDDVVTVFNANWRPAYSEEKRVIPYEANVATLGHRERDFDFWIYQDSSLVEKSASFWGARYARVWRLVRVKAFLDALGLDVLDSVIIYLTDLNLPSSKSIVRELAHNTQTHLIDLLLWLPIEAGVITQSSSAWVDDTGDTKPADPSVNVSEGSVEIESVPPTQFNFPVAISQASLTIPAKISADLTGGIYRAVTYPSGFGQSPSDTIILNKVGDTDFSVDDEFMATKSEENGAWYGSKGGGAGTQVTPGLISSGSLTGPYTIALYANGPDQAATESVSAYPLYIAATYSFPTNIWVFVIYLSTRDRYYFQAATWLDDS